MSEPAVPRRTPARQKARQLAKHLRAAQPISPHGLRHFPFTWLKTQGIDDALIQPYSGHQTRRSLEIYTRLALPDAQAAYDHVIGRFPV
jgi:integrase/recombinase XerD